MYKFIFRKDCPTIRLDKSIIIKGFHDNSHKILEVDCGLVARELGISEEEAAKVATSVLMSIFRMEVWEQGNHVTSSKEVG